MIVVNTNQTYPQAVSGGRVDFDALEQLTCGDWPPMRDSLLDAAADVLIGTYNNVVTVFYNIRGWTRQTNGKLRFHVTSAPNMANWIGQPMPGGPWKKGEARGIRRIATPDDGPHRMPQHATWKGAIAATARQLLSLDEVPDHEVTVVTRADGTIVVTVPAGAPVLVQPRKKVVS